MRQKADENIKRQKVLRNKQNRNSVVEVYSD